MSEQDDRYYAVHQFDVDWYKAVKELEEMSKRKCLSYNDRKMIAVDGEAARKKLSAMLHRICSTRNL